MRCSPRVFSEEKWKEKWNKDNLDIKPLTSALTLTQRELIDLETRSWFPTPHSQQKNQDFLVKQPIPGLTGVRKT